MSISPDHAAHKTLEQEVNEFLDTLGYLTVSPTYHETFPPQVKEVLQFRDTWTSLYIRGRADRLAVHPDVESEFEWEVKTHDNEAYNDLCIELLPLLHHLKKAELGVRCMYIFRVPHTKTDGAFWVKANKRANPPVRQAFITPRWPASGRGYIESMLNEYLPNAKLEHRDKTGGTSDPFVVIDAATLPGMDHWMNVIEAEYRRAENA